MKIETPDIDSIIKELRFTTSRSGGPGGQGVNKVNTKVTFHWHVQNSIVLDETQKEVIEAKLASKINNLGELVLSDQSSRSQLENKEAVINKLSQLITMAFTIPKARKATKPTKGSVKRRLDNKKKLSNKKKLRRGFED